MELEDEASELDFRHEASRCEPCLTAQDQQQAALESVLNVFQMPNESELIKAILSTEEFLEPWCVYRDRYLLRPGRTTFSNALPIEDWRTVVLKRFRDNRSRERLLDGTKRFSHTVRIYSNLLWNFTRRGQLYEKVQTEEHCSQLLDVWRKLIQCLNAEYCWYLKSGKDSAEQGPLLSFIEKTRPHEENEAADSENLSDTDNERTSEEADISTYEFTGADSDESDGYEQPRHIRGARVASPPKQCGHASRRCIKDRLVPVETNEKREADYVLYRHMFGDHESKEASPQLVPFQSPYTAFTTTPSSSGSKKKGMRFSTDFDPHESMFGDRNKFVRRQSRSPSQPQPSAPFFSPNASVSRTRGVVRSKTVNASPDKSFSKHQQGRWDERSKIANAGTQWKNKSVQPTSQLKADPETTPDYSQITLVESPSRRRADAIKSAGKSVVNSSPTPTQGRLVTPNSGKAPTVRASPIPAKYLGDSLSVFAMAEQLHNLIPASPLSISGLCGMSDDSEAESEPEDETVSTSKAASDLCDPVQPEQQSRLPSVETSIQPIQVNVTRSTCEGSLSDDDPFVDIPNAPDDRDSMGTNVPIHEDAISAALDTPPQPREAIGCSVQALPSVLPTIEIMEQHELVTEFQSQLNERYPSSTPSELSVDRSDSIEVPILIDDSADSRLQASTAPSTLAETSKSMERTRKTAQRSTESLSSQKLPTISASSTPTRSHRAMNPSSPQRGQASPKPSPSPSKKRRTSAAPLTNTKITRTFVSATGSPASSPTKYFPGDEIDPSVVVPVFEKE